MTSKNFMAEIKIEKKQPIWPWILAALAVLALLAYYFIDTDKEDDVAQESSETSDLSSVQENNGTVAAYVDFVKSDTNRMTLDHHYTSEALTKLRQATEAMANEADYDIQADLTEVKQYADQITNDAFETSHANSIRKAADIAARSLKNMQQAKYPSLSAEADQVSSAASAINPDVLTLDQKDQVKGFFDQAADLLAKMN